MFHRQRLRRPASLWTRGVVASGCVLVAAGCTGSDDKGGERTDLDTADRSACEAFFDDLPRTLAGEREVAVDAERLSKAYGSPPIVVECGVSAPPGFGATAQCEVSGHVGWYVPAEQYDSQTVDVTLFAITYSPVVEVQVPAEYRPNGVPAALADLADPVKDNLVKGKSCLS